VALLYFSFLSSSAAQRVIVIIFISTICLSLILFTYPILGLIAPPWYFTYASVVWPMAGFFLLALVCIPLVLGLLLRRLLTSARHEVLLVKRMTSLIIGFALVLSGFGVGCFMAIFISPTMAYLLSYLFVVMVSLSISLVVVILVLRSVNPSQGTEGKDGVTQALATHPSVWEEQSESEYE